MMTIFGAEENGVARGFNDSAVSFFAVSQFLLDPLAVGDVAGHRLETDHMAIFHDQLGVLPKPDLMAVFGDNGTFVIGILNPLYQLTTEELHGFVTHVRADKCRIMFSDNLLFFVSRNPERRRIYEGEASRVVRFEDDIARIFHQVSDTAPRSPAAPPPHACARIPFVPVP